MGFQKIFSLEVRGKNEVFSYWLINEDYVGSFGPRVRVAVSGLGVVGDLARTQFHTASTSQSYLFQARLT